MPNVSSSAIAHALRAILNGRIDMTDDRQYVTNRGAPLDDAIYAAEEDDLIVFGVGGWPQVTDAGRAWLDAWSRPLSAPQFSHPVEVA